MGHDHHFLSRLDRVDRTETDFALGLYRDHGLVRLLLDGLQIPPGVSRVALALRDEPEAPHIIVARDGHFVTCLGAGMNVGDHPRVTRARVDATIARVATLRDRMRDLQAQPEGRTRALMERIYTAGSALSREEFGVLARWQPVLDEAFMASYYKMYTSVTTRAKALSHQVRGVRAPSDADLHAYWNGVWAMGHLFVLATMGSRHPVERRLAVEPRVFDHVAFPLVASGWLPLAVRAWWGLGKVGKTVLPRLKHVFTHHDHLANVMEAGGGLTVMAMRHPRLQAEIRKTLSHRGPDAEGRDGVSRRWFATHALRTLDGIDDAVAYVTGAGHAEYESRRADLEKRWPDVYPPGAPCSDPLARTIASSSLVYDPIHDSGGLTLALRLLPWLARVGPEELYTPYAWERQFPAWDRSSAILMLTRIRQLYGTSSPTRVEKVPGRNDPCSCGSGKKFKRCCEGTAKDGGESAER